MVSNSCNLKTVYKPVFILLIALLFISAGSNAALFTWVYKGQALSLDYTFDAADYRYYKSQSKFVQNIPSFAEEHVGHTYLAAFAEALRQKAQQHQWLGVDERNMVIRFVQEVIPYKNDPYNRGYDYPRYPIETLYEQRGDCEDKSCLMVALLKTLGHDAVLLEFSNHMAVGVEDSKSSDYIYNGKNYVFVETTSVFEPGVNSGYSKGKVKEVNQTAYAGLQPPVKSRQSSYIPISAKKINHPIAKATVTPRAKEHTYRVSSNGRPVVKCTAAYLEKQRTAIVKRQAAKSTSKTYTRTAYVMNGKIIAYTLERN